MTVASTQGATSTREGEHAMSKYVCNIQVSTTCLLTHESVCTPTYILKHRKCIVRIGTEVTRLVDVHTSYSYSASAALPLIFQNR